MKKSRFLPFVSFPAVLLGFALALASAAFGDVPRAIFYQGYLTDDAGDPLTGPVAITFRLFPVEGTAIWTEPHATVQLNEGRFAVALGEITDLPADFSQPLYLEIEVNGETLSPRLPLRSAPYALQAAQAGKVDANGVDSAAVAAGAVTKAKLGRDIAGAGLAQNGDGSLQIALEGVDASMIADSAISNQHISATAAIAPEKIAGTAATLDGTETLVNKTLSEPVIRIADDSFTIFAGDEPTYSLQLQLDPPRGSTLQRTLVVPDADGTLALEGYVQTYVDTQLDALAPVATSGSFADLTGVPSFARLDMPNTFTAAGQAITLDPIGAYPNTTLLQVLGSLERTGSPLFTVDTEGDVTAMSFAGNGAGLTHLASSNLEGSVPASQVSDLAPLATSSNFSHLVGVPDFARRDTNNAFAGQNTFRSEDASANAVALMVLSSPSIPEPVFTVDAEGDVVASSLAGNGAGLTNLAASNLVGTIPFSQVTVGSKAITNTMLASDAFAVTLDSNLTGSTNVALGGTLALSVNTTNLTETIAGSGLSSSAGKLAVNTTALAGDMAGWGLMAGGTQLAVDSVKVAPAMANKLAGKGLRHDTVDDTLAIEFDAGLTLNGNLLAPDVDGTTVTVNGDGKLAVPIDNATIGLDVTNKLAVKSVASVPIVLDTNVPTVPAHGALIFADSTLQVYDAGQGKWIKIGTYQ